MLKSPPPHPIPSHKGYIIISDILCTADGDNLKLGTYNFEGVTVNVTRGDYSPLLKLVSDNLLKAKVSRAREIKKNALALRASSLKFWLPECCFQLPRFKMIYILLQPKTCIILNIERLSLALNFEKVDCHLRRHTKYISLLTIPTTANFKSLNLFRKVPVPR